MQVFEKTGDYEAFERTLSETLQETPMRICAYSDVRYMLPILPISDLSRFFPEGGLCRDRTNTIIASVNGAGRNMVISIGLVIVVVFLFLRNGWATFIPSVSVPISLIATFGAMYLIGYNLDNLSLTALTIATGFVVDDAIVVIENISRHIEGGMKPM